MDRTAAELIAHRANALAYVALTRRDDVVVMKFPEEGELDLLARLNSPHDRLRRFFGVVLRGTSRALDESAASRDLNGYFRSSDKGRGPIQYPFPVIALIFSMEDDQGFYDWRARPVVKTDGLPGLEIKRALNCRNFTKGALDAVVEAVNEWYDLLFPAVVAG